MKRRRLIPFSTLFLWEDNNGATEGIPQTVLIEQINLWMKGDSFNRNGVVYLLTVEAQKKILYTFSISSTGSIAKNSENISELSGFSLCLRLRALNLSLVISLSPSATMGIYAVCSGAGHTIGPSSLLSLLLYKERFGRITAEKPFRLSQDIPNIFNDISLKSTGYIQTKYIEDFSRLVDRYHTKREEHKKHHRDLVAEFGKSASHHAHESIDLGKIVDEKASAGYLLWVPHAKKSKTAFKDFVDITFIAEQQLLSITAFFRDEQSLKQFKKDFYIKGRKIDFDRYLHVTVGDRELCDRLALGATLTLFSSSMDSLYRRERKRLGAEQVTTLHSYKKRMKEEL